MTSEISIRIGQFERVYRLYRTRAPQSYDGFGTLTVFEYDGSRVVLISMDALDWQLGRYASGMMSGQPCNDLDPTRLQEFFLKRLFGDNE